MRIELLFGAPFSKKELAEVFPIPSRAEASTVGEVTTALCNFYTSEPWFPPSLKPADIELYTESGAHFNRRSPATVFQTKPLEPDLRICVVVRKTFSRSERTVKRCQACGKDKSRMDFARRKRKGGAHDCKECTEKARQAQAEERAISVQPEDQAQQVLPRPASTSEAHTGRAQRIPETAPLEPTTVAVTATVSNAVARHRATGQFRGENKPPKEVAVPVEDRSQERNPQVHELPMPRMVPRLYKGLPHFRVTESTPNVRMGPAKDAAVLLKCGGQFLLPGDVVCEFARENGFICISELGYQQPLWVLANEKHLVPIANPTVNPKKKKKR